ncbi:MAG: hypothetical protein M1818_006552 [Claussenomyces sp. TS43310]|nr:MAG: hypothetical protein M1818_006552 [Claussenomyces sp. TS43310]
MMRSAATRLLAALGIAPASGPQALVHTTQGTIGGYYLPELRQNVYLGVPYAQPPIGRLRFAQPQPINESWQGVKSATSHGPSCYGFGSFSDGLNFNEDCLSLNIVVPAEPYGSSSSLAVDENKILHVQGAPGTDESWDRFGDNSTAEDSGQVGHDDLLPVFFWVHGGGFIGGGSADPRYNLSYIVDRSVASGKPIIAVSINYRMTGFGFLTGGDIPAADGNQGLLDQRLALQWVSENIRAFGGDPSKVTLAGESAGGWSVGYQVVAYDGDDQGLFRSAIMQSGTGYGKAFQSHDFYTRKYRELLSHTKCEGADQTLHCLREIPAEQLYEIFINTSPDFFWDPVIDGKFLSRIPYELMDDGKFAKVALLLGTNMDECTIPTLGPRGFFNTSEDLKDFLMHGIRTDPGYRIISPLITSEEADRLLTFYPDEPALGCPYNTGSERSAELGYQFKRGAALVSDWIMQVGRRQTAQLYSESGQRVYSYIFNQVPWDGIETGVVEDEPVGVPHFTEVAYIFSIPDETLINWLGPDPGYLDLSHLMSRMWISFIATQDPNNHKVPEYANLTWPKYTRDAGQNLIFQVNSTVVEPDNFREEGFKFWMDTWRHTTFETAV